MGLCRVGGLIVAVRGEGRKLWWPWRREREGSRLEAAASPGGLSPPRLPAVCACGLQVAEEPGVASHRPLGR